jgi:tetratricopeptide (TPR) repeat protein
VRSIDIAPTILALLGLPALPNAQGVDLSPLIFGKQDDLGLVAYSETFYTRYNLGFAQLRALRSAGWKYIHAPRPELYNLVDDAQEEHDLAESYPERVSAMRASMLELIQHAPRVVQPGQARRQVTAQELQRLESLGYVGATGETEPELADEEVALFEPVGPNPMDHKREIHLTTRAVGLVQTGQYQKIEQAIRELLAEVGERSDRFVWAHAHLAGALAAQGKLEPALEHFDLAIKARPEDGQMYTMKGIVLRALNRPDEALAAFQQAVTLEPVFATTHLNFGATLAENGQIDEAIAQFRLAIEKDPLSVRGYANLAQLLIQVGHGAEAITLLDQGIASARDARDQEALSQLKVLRERAQRPGTGDASP